MIYIITIYLFTLWDKKLSTIFANKNNITNIKDKFDKWNKLAKVKAQECRNGIISFDDLKIWFKTNQDWHKK